MSTNRLESFGHGSSSGNSDRPYADLQPAEHNGVCWAAAIGTAAHQRPNDHGTATARLALAMLADGTAACLCTRTRAAWRRRRR